MSITWQQLTNVSQLEDIDRLSETTPCLLFKHSTRCEISVMAKLRLEQKWDFADDALKPYYLDLLQYRDISKAIAEKYQIHHESPQVLVIERGECTFDASHLDISVDELHDVMANM